MSKHFKRLALPKAWQIKRKEAKFAVKPTPGPHAIKRSVPLLVVIRDMLGYAKNAREARYIISRGNVLVDRKVRKNYKFPVGLMDIVEIPKMQSCYMVLVDKREKLSLKQIPMQKAKYKLCRINGKSLIKGGKIQLHLHDGRNILVKSNEYKPKDTILLDLDSKKIKNHYSYKPGSRVYIVGGSHSGKVAVLKDVRVTRSSKPNMAILQDEKEFETIEDYIFVIGKKRAYLGKWWNL